jgi:hypothetical protein
LRELAEPDARLAFFTMRAEAWQAEPDADIPLSLCFAWSAAQFRAWHAAAPLVLGGFYRENGLTLTQNTTPVRHCGAARLTRAPAPGVIETAINALSPEWRHA